MNRHTPGPWIVEDRPPNMKIIFAGITPGQRLSPCLLMDGDQEANAYLIAAAPDLLAALQLVAAQLPTIDKIACEAVRAAIAKATNSQPEDRR